MCLTMRCVAISNTSFGELAKRVGGKAMCDTMHDVYSQS